jgi:methionine aminopeptidase
VTTKDEPERIINKTTAKLIRRAYRTDRKARKACRRIARARRTMLVRSLKVDARLRSIGQAIQRVIDAFSRCSLTLRIPSNP